MRCSTLLMSVVGRRIARPAMIASHAHQQEGEEAGKRVQPECPAAPKMAKTTPDSPLEGASGEDSQHNGADRSEQKWQMRANDGATIECMAWEMRRLRQWEYTGLGQLIRQAGAAAREDRQFTVMSYNVLAQDLLVGHPELYGACDPRIGEWEARKDGLFREFRDFNCDILCLQEVQEDHYISFFLPALESLGYEGLYKKRTGTRSDGCATFWKDSKFTLREMCSVEYFQPGVDILNRDNVALITKLKFNDSDEGHPSNRYHHYDPGEVCVANTHLLYNPKRPDVRLAQLQILFAEVDRIAFEKFLPTRVPQYLPVIICGDLNTSPGTPVYKFVTEGQIRIQGACSRTLSFPYSFPPYGGSGYMLGMYLIPSFLQVDDWCRHRFVQVEREKGNRGDGGEVHVYHSAKGAYPKKFEGTIPEAPPGLFGTGWLCHQLRLDSVYKHHLPRARGAPEATTKQIDWTTVDYIFYGTTWSDRYNARVEGSLKLVAKYGLLSPWECNNFGSMPNWVSPSDHYPLIAMFVVRQ